MSTARARLGCFFFTRKSFVKFVLLILQRNFLVNWSETSSRKFYKRIPFNFDLGSFYKGFPLKNFFTRKTFVKFFPIIKLESDFFHHFLSKIRKDENCENFFILNYNWNNFQWNRGQKNSSLHFTSLTSLHFTSLHSWSLATLVPW